MLITDDGTLRAPVGIGSPIIPYLAKCADVIYHILLQISLNYQSYPLHVYDQVKKNPQLYIVYINCKAIVQYPSTFSSFRALVMDFCK